MLTDMFIQYICHNPDCARSWHSGWYFVATFRITNESDLKYPTLNTGMAKCDITSTSKKFRSHTKSLSEAGALKPLRLTCPGSCMLRLTTIAALQYFGTRRKKGPHDTAYSLTVTHPSTNHARPGLTSVITQWRMAGFKKHEKRFHIGLLTGIPTNNMCLPDRSRYILPSLTSNSSHLSFHWAERWNTLP